MDGLMQDWPLRLHRLLDHAAIQHGGREVVSRSNEGPIHRTTYAALRERSLRVAKRLVADGVRHGDRVGTLALNTWRHLEAWYGIAGAGAVIHTVNPRLFPDQVAFIVAHAGDRVMMVDPPFVPLLEGLVERLPALERVIVLTDAAHMPTTRLPGAISFEDWIAPVDADFAWAAVDERAAAGLCYTSGTTGEPKGVLYSHRSNVLHTWMICAGGSLCPLPGDCILMIVPMFHANAWGLAFAGPMSGAKLVMPGARLDGDALFELMEAEGVTIAAGVPTVLMGLLATMRGRGRKPAGLRLVTVGGSACPRAVVAAFEGEFGVTMFHAWGMTETSPLGTVGTIKPGDGPLTFESRVDLKTRQGSAPFGVEMIVADDAGRPLPWDGRTPGRVKVRGPAVARRLLRVGRGDPRRRRLLRHGGRRDDRAQRVDGHHRPRQGRDQVRRRVDLLHRHRERGDRPSRRRGGGRDRHRPSQVDGAAAVGGRAGGGEPTGRPGHPRPPVVPRGPVVAARRRPLRRRPPAHRHRQDRQGGLARAVRGLSSAWLTARRHDHAREDSPPDPAPMRRLILQDPFARSAIWSRNLAVFALLVAVLGIVLARRGLDPTAALAVEGGALAIAGLAILSALVAMVVIWRNGYRGIGLALGGLALSGLLMVYPAYLAVEARTAPVLLDVSTDPADPPAFMVSDKALDARHGATPGPPSAADRATQARLYPDLQSLSLDADALDVDKTLHKIIKRHKWTITDEVQPIRFATGHIDIVLKSALMGFPVDLTFRVRGLGNHTQVDVRSVARAGWQERPGADAALVQTLVDEIDQTGEGDDG